MKPDNPIDHDRWSEHFAVAALNAVGAHVCAISSDGSILWVNSAWDRFAAENNPGRVHPERCAQGANYFDACRCGSADPWAEQARAAAQGLRLLLEGKTDSFTFDYPCDAPGEKRWFSLRAYPFCAAGVHGAVIAHIDITKIKESERAARLLAEENMALLGNALTGIAFVGPDFRVVSANPKFAEIFGLPPGQIQAYPCARLFEEPGLEKAVAGICADNNGSVSMPMKTHGGRRFWARLSITGAQGPSADPQSPESKSLWIVEDIQSEIDQKIELNQHRKHLEEMVAERSAKLTEALRQQRMANESKDSFVSNITHELRSPLAAIIGYAELIELQTPKNTQESAYLQKIAQNCSHMSKIINDLLDISKIAKGKLEIVRRPMRIHSLLERVRSGAGLLATQKNIEFILEASPELPDYAIGDALRIEQILINLCSNACKFTAEGHVKLSACARPDPQKAENLLFCAAVEDTGIGIRPEEQELLFTPFAQANGAISGKFGGTGLGLSLSRLLANEMGGTLSCRSEPGQGSVFELSVPLRKTDQTPQDDDEDAAKFQYVFPRARILVADDQEHLREICKAMLGKLQADCVLAKNGADALEIMSQSADPFDAVLLDVQMPVMDGLACARALRSNPQNASLPILAMSANAMVHEKKAQLDAGMSDWLPKPFTLRQLASSLQKHLPSKARDACGSDGFVLDTADPLCQKWSALKGLDVRQGAKIQGSLQSLEKWVLDFSDSLPIILSEMNAMLAERDFDQAAKCAHAIKGRSAMLGLNSLFQCSKNIEEILSKTQDAKNLCKELNAQAAEFCHNAKAIQAQGLPPALPGSCGGKLTAQSAEQLRKTAALLAEHKAGGIDELADFCSRHGLAGSYPGLDLALDKANRFDLPGAAACIAKLLAENGL